MLDGTYLIDKYWKNVYNSPNIGKSVTVIELINISKCYYLLNFFKKVTEQICWKRCDVIKDEIIVKK